ncbi:MAG: sialate O-acetylesterase [Bacteroidota bacterium]
MKKLALLILLFISFVGNAQLKLARLVSDHVVLQRQKPIPIWGWTAVNQPVTVILGDSKVTTNSDASGKWLAKLPAMEAGGPYTLSVSDGKNNLSVNDILIGEVWLLSGQSNMEWRTRSAKDFAKEKKDANYPKIRHFFVEHEVTMTPQTDLKSGDWKLASEETVGDFSAIGFFFAREIFQKTNVPIGLLHSSWGGSQIEGWISKEAMLSSSELSDYAKNIPANWLEADAITDKKLRTQIFGSAAINPSFDDEAKYLKTGYDFSKWLNAPSPIGQWDWKGLFSYRGKGFMAKTIDITASMAQKATVLGLGIQNSRNQIYINGRLIADTTISGIRKYNIPPSTWKTGQNQLVIKFENMTDPKYYGLGLMGNPSDLYVAGDNERVDISENWKILPSFAEPHEYIHSANNVGTTIYNSMIAPLVPFAIRGVLWYQGESNAGRAYQYRQTFPLMINDWRKAWKDDFSFYWVQLSSFGGYQNSNQGSGWAELREAQTMTLSLPKTGMAVTTDIGDPKDIHPTNKQDVAKRLAATALKNDYGIEVIPSGPMFESVSFKKGKAIITYKNIGKGLMIKDRFGYLKGFEIAGSDKVFQYAKATIVDNKVVVEFPNKKKPAAVRYAWADAPDDTNLFNSEGYPANGFRTDDWNTITKGKKFE